jgi:7-cyano-7-deazaguanine synthase in queuosine biosynthesis
MPRHEHLVLCGGLTKPRGGSAHVLDLNLHGPSPNVHLRITDISKPLLANVPDVLVDLLEVASYIYTADAAVSRGGETYAQMGASWRRKFRFVIPVRQPDLWSSNVVLSALTETLSFVSEDAYLLEFRPLEHPPALETYFEFPDAEETGFSPDEVILFSGGLDSFAGAVEQLAEHGKKIVLVSHRSSSKIVGTQRYLVGQLQSRFGINRVLHVPVWATLDGSLGKEPTHRVRSFLFAALGTVTARIFGKNRVCFFENGVVSLNLPPVAQVVGARATRTTHPQALAGFSRVLTAVLGQPIALENPFAWLTKTEVVERIAANRCGDLIRDTRSCTRVHDMTNFHPHCGRCSQCLDRRFAILAAGQEQEDPEEAYKVDLFSGDRQPGLDQEMALAFVRSASKIQEMTDVAFFFHYGETSRVIGFFPERTDAVASRILDLHRRHASAVCRVFDEAISAHAADLRQGNLPATCLLSLVVNRQGNGDPDFGQPTVVEQDDVIASEVRMVINEKAGRVILERWGEVKGQSAQLIITLAGPFRQAMKEECAPENYPFTKTPNLRRQINCADDEALRKLVQRSRNKFSQLATRAGDPPPSIEAVIESSQWHGYRFNPNQVRIVALSDLQVPP